MKIKIFFLIILVIISLIFIFYKFFIMDDNKNADSSQTGQGSSEEEGADNTPVFFVQSQAYEDEGRIPDKYCNKSVSGGENVSIPIEWKNVPEGTKSLFLVIVDTHPVANRWIHWAVADIAPSSGGVPEGASGTGKMPAGSRELAGTSGDKNYQGPQPPAGTGDHPYEIHLFALSKSGMDIPQKPSWEQINSALEPALLDEVQYTGYFGR